MDDLHIKILHLEDDPGDARLVKEMLADIRAASHVIFNLVYAARLDQALAILAGDHSDIILADLNLPDTRGLEVVKEIRRVALALPIVVMSGLGDEELAVQAVQAGAQDYLVKGRIDPHLLTRAIRYAIERKRASLRCAVCARLIITAGCGETSRAVSDRDFFRTGGMSRRARVRARYLAE